MSPLRKPPRRFDTVSASEAFPGWGFFPAIAVGDNAGSGSFLSREWDPPTPTFGPFVFPKQMPPILLDLGRDKSDECHHERTPSQDGWGRCTRQTVQLDKD